MKKIFESTKEKSKSFLQLVLKHYIISIIIFVVLIAAGWFAYPKIFGKAQTVEYQTAVATKGTIISTLTQSGSVVGNATTVSSPTNGIISELYVSNNDEVYKGQELFKVSSTATAQEKATAYTSYQSALNSLTSAKNSKMSLDASMWSAQRAVLDAQNSADYKNANSTNPSTKTTYTDLERQSIESSLIQAHKDFAAAEQKYKDADRAITAAQAALSSSWLAYQATQDVVVTAPASGTVANLSVALGGTVTTGSNSSSTSSTSTSGTSVLLLSNPNNLQVKVSVSEVDVLKVAPGQKATVTLDALPDKTYVAEVMSVDSIGTTSSGVVTYTVYLNLVSPPPEVKPGMTATAAIQTQRGDDVVIVPSAAVQTVNGEKTVRIMQNGTPVSVPVETGIISDSETEIISGLQEGATVVTSSTATTTQTTTTGQTSPFSSFGRGGASGGAAGGAVRITR